MRRTRPRPRRAVFLAETAAAGLILALAMVLIVRLVSWTAVERRSAERRGWAIQEAANAMEVLAALPFDRLTTASARAAAKLSPSAAAILPGGAVEVAVSDEAPMKRISLSIRWAGPSGRPESPVRLTAWVARKGGRP